MTPQTAMSFRLFLSATVHLRGTGHKKAHCPTMTQGSFGRIFSKSAAISLFLDFSVLGCHSCPRAAAWQSYWPPSTVAQRPRRNAGRILATVGDQPMGLIYVFGDQEAGDFWGDFPVIFHRLKLLFPEICT